jgi:hypothetical protein
MFRVMRNSALRGTAGSRAAADHIRKRLPPGWSAELRPGVDGTPLLAVRAPDGREAVLAVVSRKCVDPRDLLGLAGKGADGAGQIFLVAPFLSPLSRELLAKSNVAYSDATGNLRLVTGDPAIFLEDKGADRDPERQPRRLRSLKGPAGRVVRALCDFMPPYGVRTLAEVSSTPLGTVSRVVSFLEEEALVTRDEKKAITSVDWPALIARNNATAANRNSDTELDARVSALADRTAPLIEKLRETQGQAHALGIFPNDRELLVCPKCGLSENVLADGRLITFREPNYNDDTGLRFIEPKAEGGPFICPECRNEAREEEIEIPSWMEEDLQPPWESATTLGVPRAGADSVGSRDSARRFARPIV